jgi:hypothetical protein
MWNYDAAGMYPPGSDPMYLCIIVYLGLYSTGSYVTYSTHSPKTLTHSLLKRRGTQTVASQGLLYKDIN